MFHVPVYNLQIDDHMVMALTFIQKKLSKVNLDKLPLKVRHAAQALIEHNLLAA